MSPRTLVLLALAAVGLLGLALWEVLDTGPSRPVVATEKGKTESPPEEGPTQDKGARDGPREVRKRLREQAEAAPAGVGTAAETDVDQRPRDPESGGATGQAPTLEEAREGFAYVMEELALVRKRRRRISQEQWERHYREANDAFAALSARLRAGDKKQRAELENAHKLLKERLGRLRVRGKKHEAP